jgi:hypothetical protein
MVRFFRNMKARTSRDTSLGRNDRCWCGSGKKYKDCHWESDRRYLARIRSASCGRYS